MLSELTALLECVPSDGLFEDYRRAVVEENALLKISGATRRKSFKHLHELYALDAGYPPFSALRTLRRYDRDSLPMLALLAAAFRDELLRASAVVVLDSPAGTPLGARAFSAAVAGAFPDRLGPTTLTSVGQRAASSFTQSGHLEGRVKKVRRRARASFASAAYALFLGYLTGERGLGLYETLWARLLDVSAEELDALAFAAGQRGILEYRRVGEVADISFSGLAGGRIG